MPSRPRTSSDIWEPIDELPPVVASASAVAPRVVERLRTERPNQWTRVRVGSHSHTSFCRALRSLGAEVVTRTDADRRTVVIARVVVPKVTSGQKAANDRSAADVLALQTRTRPQTAVATVQRMATAAPTISIDTTGVDPTTVAAEVRTSAVRMADLRAAMRDWHVARRAGFRPSDLLERIPDDVLAGTPRPATLVDLAMDADLHARVVEWLKEESAA